jgi:hypothetical protein
MPSIHVSLSAIINVGNVCRCLSGPNCRGLGMQHHLEYRTFSQVCSLVALGAMHPAVGVRCLSLIVGHGWAVGQVALGQGIQWSACKCLRACGGQATPVAPDGVPISVWVKHRWFHRTHGSQPPMEICLSASQVQDCVDKSTICFSGPQLPELLRTDCSSSFGGHRMMANTSQLLLSNQDTQKSSVASQSCGWSHLSCFLGLCEPSPSGRAAWMHFRVEDGWWGHLAPSSEP